MTEHHQHSQEIQKIQILHYGEMIKKHKTLKMKTIAHQIFYVDSDIIGLTVTDIITGITLPLYIDVTNSLDEKKIIIDLETNKEIERAKKAGQFEPVDLNEPFGIHVKMFQAEVETFYVDKVLNVTCDVIHGLRLPTKSIDDTITLITRAEQLLRKD